MAGYQSADVAVGVSSGATVPTSPVVGQWFLHTPTGRKVLLQYDGSNWIAIMSFGDVIVYVDKTDGTDDINHGSGVDANAFATIQYAIDSLPPVLSGEAQININGESYTEDVKVQAKYVGKADKYLRLIGTMSQLASLAATGGNIGSGSTPAQVTGSFTSGQYDNKLIHFTSGSNNGLCRIIGQTTTTTIYLVGGPLAAAPQNGDTYEILDWATTIQSLDAHGQKVLKCEFLAFAHNTGMAVVYGFRSDVRLHYCSVTNNGAVYGFNVDQGFGGLFYCYVKVAVSGYYIGVGSDWAANLDCEYSRVVGYGGTNGIGIRCNCMAGVNFISCEIEGFQYGITVQNHSFGDGSCAGSVTNFIHGCATAGINAASHSMYGETTGASHITFGQKLNGDADANGTDTDADAPSFSWIGA